MTDVGVSIERVNVQCIIFFFKNHLIPNPDLGRCLIVFFIFSRKEMPVMPKDTMILYNTKLYV